MASILIAKGKLVVPFILCIYITSVTGTTTITTSCNGLVSEPLNITCTIDPYSSRTSITIPDGTSAGACSAPVPNIVCTQIAPYTTVHTNVGTENTFVVTIPSLDIGTHNGTWTCNHGSEMSTGEVCVNTLLSPQGKEPTFTAIHTSAKLITLSGEVYCQHPISAVTFKVLYAEQNGAYTSFNPQPSVSIQNLGSNGCGSHESNVSFNGILSCGNYTLAGKTFTLMARFTQSNLPPDSNTYNVTISGNFSCPDVETTTTMRPSEEELSTVAIVGIVIAAVACFLTISGIIAFCVCKNKGPLGFSLAENGTNAVRLTWERRINGGHKQTFVISYTNTVTRETKKTTIEVTNHNSNNTKVIDGLVPGTTYNFLLHLINVEDNDTLSDKLIVQTEKASPEAPSEFSLAEKGRKSVKVKWKRGFNGGHAQTFVIRYTNTDSRAAKEITIEDTDHNPSYTQVIDGLTPNTTYHFWIYSTNKKGDSTLSDKLVVQTLKVLSVL